MAYRPTESQMDQLARGITLEMLKEFYADPKNQAAFEAWLKEKGKKNAG